MKKLTTEEIERLSLSDFKKVVKLPVVVVLDNIRSQHNIGSVFRTADAFRIDCIHLCGITATPPNREIHKTALGATESVDWKYFPTTNESIQLLKSQGYVIIAVEQAEGSINVKDYESEENSKVAIVFGNEVHGVDNGIMELADICLEIPQYGTKHSLNVSVSAGIVIWEIFKKSIII
ncbi:MAG: RNA methyltransferase [Lentimicrobiaceae bacterium]